MRHLVLTLGLVLPAPLHALEDDPPNVVIVFTDDQGYGDLSCFGNPTIHTPHLDALAASGTKLTQFYVSQPLCSPSRASLLTGCYAKRLTMHDHVIFPQYDYGMHTDEVTIADMLQEAGYATGMFGKWHLGHRPGLLPLDQGFQRWSGVPYSNDMAQIHRPKENKYRYRLPYMEDGEVVEWEPDQRLLTRRATEAAVAFIDEHADEPFLVYVPHSMPHIPLYASAEFEGGSPRGLYGDVIEEIDWSVGQLVAALERNGVRDETIVLFTTDNGPWLPFKLHGGTAGPLRGGKGTNYEGGQRVPAILSWPGHVPANHVERTVTTTMDVLPTLATLCNAVLPQAPIDGQDVSELWLGRGPGPEPKPFLYYTNKGKLAGVRRGPWKLLLEPGELYHVERDISEAYDVAKNNAKLVQELRQLASDLDAEITANMRPHRKVDEVLFDPVKPDARK